MSKKYAPRIPIITRAPPEGYASSYARQRPSMLRRVARNKAFADEIKEKNPCIDCGYKDIRALEFDHRDPEKKKTIQHFGTCIARNGDIKIKRRGEKM